MNFYKQRILQDNKITIAKENGIETNKIKVMIDKIEE